MAMPEFQALIMKEFMSIVHIITQTSANMHTSTDATINTNANSIINARNHAYNSITFINKYFKHLESQIAYLGSKFKVHIDHTKNKGNLLRKEIHNTLLVGINKDLEFKKLNGEIDPITHMQGFEYILEFKYGINEHLKVKQFHMSLTSKTHKWFHSLELGFITSYQQLKGQFKTHFRCNMKK